MSNVKFQMSNVIKVKGQMSNFKCLMRNVKSQISNAKCHMSYIKCQI